MTKDPRNKTNSYSKMITFLGSTWMTYAIWLPVVVKLSGTTSCNLRITRQVRQNTKNLFEGIEKLLRKWTFVRQSSRRRKKPREMSLVFKAHLFSLQAVSKYESESWSWEGLRPFKGLMGREMTKFPEFRVCQGGWTLVTRSKVRTLRICESQGCLWIRMI